MSEKAASAGVFVEIRRIIYKIYGEVTWKQKIPTTFRITSQKRTFFFGVLVKLNIETFKYLKTVGSTDGSKQKFLAGTVAKVVIVLIFNFSWIQNDVRLP